MKNKYLKSLATVACLAMFANLSNAQSSNSSSKSSGSNPDNNKFFTAWGYSPLLSYEQHPTVTYTTYQEQYNYTTGYSTWAPETQSVKVGCYDEVVFLFRVRYNLTEFNNNASLSLSVIPGAGLGEPLVASSGALSFNLPLFVEYNLGNVSTYTADQETGWVFGVGIEYTMAPLLGATVPIVNSDGSTGTYALPGWVEPAFEVGYRHWNKRNKAKEINFKFGVGSGGAFTARISWMKCIGY